MFVVGTVPQLLKQLELEIALVGQPAASRASRQRWAELEIRLMVVGLLQQVQLELAPDQDLSLQLVPSPIPRGGLMVSATAR